MPFNVAIGIGVMEFPFSGADAYWRWVDLCEAGGIDSIWQTDRLVSPTPFLECMSVMAALAGRPPRLKFGVNGLLLAVAAWGAPPPPHQIRRQRAVAGDARCGAGGAAMRDDRLSVERPAVARLWHRQ